VVKTYRTTACSCCPFKRLCTRAKSRSIDRSKYQDVIDENNKRVNENPAIYKQRQQISEHPFGTLKRSWGYIYTLVKGLKKVNGEMAIIFTMYNLRRAMSILGINELISRLTQWKPAYNLIKKAVSRLLGTRELYRIRTAV